MLAAGGSPTAGSARVIRLVARPKPISEAVALYAAARYHACLDALRGNDSLPAEILTARVLLRLAKFGSPDVDGAIDLLEAQRSGANDEASDALRGELAMVLGAAYHRADRTEDAERAFFDARAYLWSTRNAELQAELEYYEGAFAWTARELETAARHARGALAAKSVSLKCRALELLGAIAASSGDYTGQADFLEQALTRLEASERRDVWVEGHILYNLAILAREMHLTHVVDRLTARAESMPWSDETAALRVETLRHLGCCRALAGDHLTAFRLLRQSGEVAPSIPWRIFAFLDRSKLAREMGEKSFADDQLHGAERLAGGFDWNGSSGDERIALLYLAELTATQSPAEAQNLIERYRAIKRKMSPLHVMRSDRRLRAMECYGEAVVARAHGQRERAALLLEEAFGTWSTIGYTWRAVATALALYELTAEQRHYVYAAENIQPFATSWLGRWFDANSSTERSASV